MTSRQINDSVQKGNRKKLSKWPDLLRQPPSTQSKVLLAKLVVIVKPNDLRLVGPPTPIPFNAQNTHFDRP